MATLGVVLSGLGLSLPGSQHLIDALMVFVGFNLAQAVQQRDGSPLSRRTFRLAHLAWIIIPVALCCALMVAAVVIPLGSIGPETTSLGGAELAVLVGVATATLNLTVGLEGVSFVELEHLWLISLAAQAVLLTPVVVLWRRATIARTRRAWSLLGVAGGLVVVRIIAVVTGVVSVTVATTALRFDAVLIGLAIGVMPAASFHRYPATRLAYPALALLVLAVAVPIEPVVPAGTDAAMVRTTVMNPLAAILAGVVVWADAIDRLPTLFRRLLSTASVGWLADRALTIYVWHLPFLYLVGGGESASDPAITIITMVITLAAATVSHQYIEQPMRAALHRFGHAEDRVGQLSTRLDPGSLLRLRRTVGVGVGAGQPTRPQAAPVKRPAAPEPMQTVGRRNKPADNLNPTSTDPPPPEHRSAVVDRPASEPEPSHDEARPKAAFPPPVRPQRHPRPEPVGSIERTGTGASAHDAPATELHPPPISPRRRTGTAARNGNPPRLRPPLPQRPPTRTSQQTTKNIDIDLTIEMTDPKELATG